MVDSIPVFDAEVVEEGLSCLAHADVFSSGGGAVGEFFAGDLGVAVGVAEVPEWLPL